MQKKRGKKEEKRSHPFGTTCQTQEIPVRRGQTATLLLQASLSPDGRHVGLLMVKGDTSWTTCVPTCASSHFSNSFSTRQPAEAAEPSWKCHLTNKQTNKHKITSIINVHQNRSWYLITRRGYPVASFGEFSHLNAISSIWGLTHSLNLNANCTGDHLHSWWQLVVPPAGSTTLPKMLISSRMDVTCHASDPLSWKNILRLHIFAP